MYWESSGTNWHFSKQSTSPASANLWNGLLALNPQFYRFFLWSKYRKIISLYDAFYSVRQMTHKPGDTGTFQQSQSIGSRYWQNIVMRIFTSPFSANGVKTFFMLCLYSCLENLHTDHQYTQQQKNPTIVHTKHQTQVKSYHNLLSFSRKQRSRKWQRAVTGRLVRFLPSN